tara:strand:- start:2222 stop:3130 length:909 start_codon:yes stop_codon:yes gene_type:complete
MKILILGLNGQLGFELYREAIARHMDVYAFKKSELDITKKDQIKNICSLLNPKVIINAAAFTDVDGAEKHPEIAFAVNSEAVESLASICEEHSIALVHISTDYIFDGKKGDEYFEEDLENPLNVYGKSKFEGENSIRKRLEKYLIIRTSWVFGERGKNFFKTVFRHAKQNRQLNVVNDQYGGPTPVNLLAEIIMDLCVKIKRSEIAWGTYNVSGLPHCTWYDFATQIVNMAQICGQLDSGITVTPVNSSHYKTLAIRPQDTRLSNRKIMTVFDQKDFLFEPYLRHVFKNSIVKRKQPLWLKN